MKSCSIGYSISSQSTVDTNRSLHQDFRVHNIFIPISARLTGIIDWNGVDIMTDWRCMVFQKFYNVPSCIVRKLLFRDLKKNGGIYGIDTFERFVYFAKM